MGIFNKIWSAVRSVGKRVVAGAKFIGDKARSAVDFVKYQAVPFVQRIPVLGAYLENLATAKIPLIDMSATDIFNRADQNLRTYQRVVGDVGRLIN